MVDLALGAFNRGRLGDETVRLAVLPAFTVGVHCLRSIDAREHAPTRSRNQHTILRICSGYKSQAEEHPLGAVRSPKKLSNR